MKIARQEQEAIRIVLAYGDAFGYGNLIAHLATAWARRLMTRNGLDEAAARKFTGTERGYPFAMQDDLIERGEWDESGKRYQEKAR